MRFYRQNRPIFRTALSQFKKDSKRRPRANIRSRRFSAILIKANQRLTVPPIIVHGSSSRNPLSISSNARWKNHRSECDRTQIFKNSSHSPNLYPTSNSCHPRVVQNKASATGSVHQTSTNKPCNRKNNKNNYRFKCRPAKPCQNARACSISKFKMNKT